MAAAEGYAHASDFRRPGFAVVTSGPGVTNTVTALMSAFGNSAPLIVLAGQIKRADINPFGVRTYGTQEVPSEAIITPCVKRFTRLDTADHRTALVATLAEALTGPARDRSSSRSRWTCRGRRCRSGTGRGGAGCAPQSARPWRRLRADAERRCRPPLKRRS